LCADQAHSEAERRAVTNLVNELARHGDAMDAFQTLATRLNAAGFFQ